MGQKIALTGIGVINGSFKGTNRFNQKLYDGNFDGFFSKENDPENLINSAINDVKSNLFKDSLDRTAVIQIADKASNTETDFKTGFKNCFNSFHTEPNLSSALEKAEFLLDRKAENEGLPNKNFITCVIVISFAGAIVLKSFDLAVSENDRIYVTIDKTISTGHHGMDEGDKQIIIPEDVDLLTICCENPKDIAALKLTELAQLIPNEGKQSIAAGLAHDPMAGLITTSLCVYNRYYPGQKPFEISCDITNTPFYFPFSSRTWFKKNKPWQRKAVLAWAKDDNNYFILLTESGSKTHGFSGYIGLCAPLLFPVAAASKQNLRAKLEKLSENSTKSCNLNKMAKENYRKFQSTADKNFIAVVMGASNSAIKRDAGFLASGLENSFGSKKYIKTPGGSYFTPEPLGKTGKIVFVYPGVGSAYTGLGQDLFQMFPTSYDFFSQMAPDVGSFVKEKELYPRTNHELSREELKSYDQKLRKNIMEISQCGMSFSVIYTMIMAGVFNVFPEYALGYSMGEASMMASLMIWKNPGELSDKLKENDAFSNALSNDLTAVRKAWNLPNARKNNTRDKIWESYTLLEDRKKVEEIVKREEQVYITLVNTDQELVIAGNPERCMEVIKKLNCKYFPLKLALAIHSKPAYLAYDRLVDLYSLELNKPSNLKLYSSSCYLPVPLREKAVANSIAKAFCDMVDFPRLVRKVYDDGGRIFIEAGPRQTCSLWIDRILDKKKFLTVPLDNKGVKSQLSMAKAISMLMGHGVNVNAECLYEF